jgi:hypothetical protein
MFVIPQEFLSGTKTISVMDTVKWPTLLSENKLTGGEVLSG